MKILKIIMFFLIFSLFNIVLAIDTPNNVKLEDSGEDFLEISWDNVEGAGVYSISYGTKSISGTTDLYEHNEEIVVENNKGKIDNLEKNTGYYIAIKAYDDEENSSEFSDEVLFKTKGELEGLKIENLEILDTRNIKLDFNLNIKKDSLIDLSITNKNNMENTLLIEKYSINGKSVNIFFDKELIKLDKYNIVVITIEGENGEIIKEGVNGSIDFEVPENTRDYSVDNEEDFNSAGLELNQEEQESFDNSISDGKVLGGKLLDTTKQTTEKTAKEIQKMPKTGPADTALFLIFAFIASGLFFILRKKVNS